MDVRSLAYRTDLALLRLGGTEVTDRGDHLVVRTPHNPTFWWGNYLLLAEPPVDDAVDRWLARFAAEFPAARHVAIGVDGTTHDRDHLAAFADRGFALDVSTVMTASGVHEPPRPNRDAEYRALTTDADWAAGIEVTMRTDEDDYDPSEHLPFVEARSATNRKLAEAGHGAWFGAFVDGVLAAQLGILVTEPGVARYQSVETHPQYRQRGLAGTLVHHAARYAFTDLAARTLVMVADPDYVAIRIYRSVGFAATEGQAQLIRRPS